MADEQQQRESIRRELHALHEITDALEDLYQESDGEVTEVHERIEALLDQQTDETLEALVWYLRESEGTELLVDRELRRLDELKARARKRVTWAKGLIRDLLGRRGERKATVGTFRVSLRKSPQRLVGKGEPALLEDRFVREIPAKRVEDKNAIKAALKAGETVDGYHLERGPDGVVVK